MLLPPTAIRSVDARVLAAAAPGFPVTTRRALRAAGVDHRAVARRLATGVLRELWTDTYLIGPPPERLPPDLLRMAAVTAVGPRAALTSTTALERLGAWTRHDGAIHVVADRWHRGVPEHAICFHRSTTGCPDAPLLRGIPTVRPIDALLDAARVLTAHQLANVLDRLEYARLVRLDDVELALMGRPGMRGVAALRRAIELRRSGSVGTKGRSEDEMLQALTSWYCEPVVNTRGAAGIPGYEPDFVWPDQRWIVEVDGGHHLDPLQRAADEARDAELLADGWGLARIPYRQVWRDLPGAILLVEQALLRSVR